MITSQTQQEDGTDAENDEDDHSYMNDNARNRFALITSRPVDNKIIENNLSEDELTIQDAAAASYECKISRKLDSL